MPARPSRTNETPRPSRPRHATRKTNDEDGARPIATQRAIRWALLFISAVLAIDALAGDKGFFEMLRARRQHAELSGALASMRSENARLRDEARRLKEDPATIEALARKELGLIKPGEVLFVVKDRTTP
jgi:cell division protein FtsB